MTDESDHLKMHEVGESCPDGYHERVREFANHHQLDRALGHLARIPGITYLVVVAAVAGCPTCGLSYVDVTPDPHLKDEGIVSLLDSTSKISRARLEAARAEEN